MKMNLLIKYKGKTKEEILNQKIHLFDKLYYIKGVKGITFQNNTKSFCGCELTINPIYRRTIKEKLNRISWIDYLEVKE